MSQRTPVSEPLPVAAAAGPDRRRLALRWLILVAIVVLGMEALAAVGIRIANARLEAPIRRTSDIFREQSAKIRELIDSSDNGGRTMFDAQLGYRYRAGYRTENDSINAQGLRSHREYSPVPAEGVMRVAAFGDSFVYSTETDNDGSWTQLIESMFPELEVLNYGVGAYGMGQAYLRFMAEGRELSPRVVIIGFAPVMLGRTVSVYRRFLAADGNPLVKPRFLIEDGELTLVASPLSSIEDYQRYLAQPRRALELGAHDYWYRPIIYQNPLYDLSATVRLATGFWIRLDNRFFDPDRLMRGGAFNTESEAFRVQVALIEKFAADVRAAGMAPVLVIFPPYKDIVSGLSGETTSYTPLLEQLTQEGIESVDLFDAFREHADADIDAWFMPGRHYSAAANRIVAQRLGRFLEERFE